MISKKEILIPEYKRDKTLDYLLVLKSIKEIPFGVGKNLLIDFLKGDSKNSSIRKNLLQSLKNFASLKDYDKEELKSIIDNLISNNLIGVIESEKFMKVLNLTLKGNNEIQNPELFKKKLKNNFNHKSSEISESERIIFEELKPFLEKFNDNQKKAIISNKEKILCIAGAGSGKTTVLTKRIEFLSKYQGLNQDLILAITFTKKAREEMAERLMRLKVEAKVETFNSFCEKFLLRNGSKIYTRPTRVINYQNKVMAMLSALSGIGLTIGRAIEIYFSPIQRKTKTPEQLSNILMNDCFFILDYFKSKNQELYDFSKSAEPKERENARMVYMICKYLKNHMAIQGLRDYTDQVLDTIKIFETFPDLIPKFEHVLVDEYQDVNAMQIRILDLLNPKNIFCVGDPRQSIFGWRGSDINYILNFEEKFPDSEIISLTRNYRSNNHIVNLINISIKGMGMPDLDPNFESEKNIKIYNFNSELEEYSFVVGKILDSKIDLDNIFVLARTNNQLNELSSLLRSKGIPHIVKSDDFFNPTAAKKNEVTLSTIHSIKGLEAKMVFVIGCTEQNFPCKASDHPVIDTIKIEEYDKEEEEKRLFYVALSRAKHQLYLTYTGKKPTYFINPEMIRLIEG